MPPVALTIAGSDPSGGAGIQADLKTFHQLGVYGAAVITLITVQNTQTVSRVEVLPPDLVTAQIEAVVSDIKPEAAKTGALGNAGVIEGLIRAARDFDFPLVIDPVMISKHGARLLSAEAEVAMKNLLPRAALVTPNIPEAEALTGMKIDTESGMLKAARQLRSLGCRAVLIKGGHSAGEPVDLLLTDDDTVEYFAGRRVTTRNTHGTGCTYSAAITAGLAQGLRLVEAISTAKNFIQNAIETATPLGHGFGPVNHFAPVAFKQ